MEHNNASAATGQPREPFFAKEEFPFFWVVNVYAKYTQLMEIELKNRHRPFPLPVLMLSISTTEPVSPASPNTPSVKCPPSPKS